jgi:hypothetical protein
MTLSLNTASHYSTAWKTGSFAYEISYAGGRVSQCGLLNYVGSREDCQLMALIKALETVEASALAVSRIIVYQQQLPMQKRLPACAIFLKIKEKWPGIVFEFKISELAVETCRRTARKVFRQAHNH